MGDGLHFAVIVYGRVSRSPGDRVTITYHLQGEREQ